MDIKVNVEKLIYELWDNNNKLAESDSAKQLYDLAVSLKSMKNTAEVYNNRLDKVVVI